MTDIPETLKSLCVVCKGTGKVTHPAPANEGGSVTVTCFHCKGKGWVWALNLEQMAERIAHAEKALRVFLQDHYEDTWDESQQAFTGCDCRVCKQARAALKEE